MYSMQNNGMHHQRRYAKAYDKKLALYQTAINMDLKRQIYRTPVNECEFHGLRGGA